MQALCRGLSIKNPKEIFIRTESKIGLACKFQSRMQAGGASPKKA